MRYFKADNEKLQRIVDKFNDKYNCTRRHEYQHYLNALAGIGRSGQSYETKFVECCLDEVSANVAQLLEQRKTTWITARTFLILRGVSSFMPTVLKAEK